MQMSELIKMANMKKINIFQTFIMKELLTFLQMVFRVQNENKSVRYLKREELQSLYFSN